MANAQAGLPYTLTLNFYDETAGTLTDPTGAIQLDITYGSEIGLVADYAGPFTYSGASAPTPGQVYRVSTGVYAFVWTVPAAAQTGVYVANWSVTYGGNVFLVVEDFPVTGGFAPAAAATDTGFWTGSLTYNAPYGTLSIPLGAVDSNGTAWVLERVEGWDSPPSAGQVVQRSGDHGGWPTAQYFGPRIITLTVLASAQSQALRDVARAQLQQVCPISDLATFVYNEPQPKQANVRRNGSATIAETYMTMADVEFKIPLVAPDPRKYSTQVQLATVMGAATLTGITIPTTVPFTLPAQAPAGSTVITNGGTFETRPTVTITGPITGPGVTNLTTGQSVTYSSLTLGASDALTVDFNARQGYLNGVFRPADLSSSWWVLYPGPNTVGLTGTTPGGAAMAVSWQSAWV